MGTMTLIWMLVWRLQVLDNKVDFGGLVFFILVFYDEYKKQYFCVEL
jgi:hypothetical protein